jgi:hypothetical protein
MKDNLRSRNIQVNSYIGMLVVAMVATFACFYIIHVANNVPAAFVMPVTP